MIEVVGLEVGSFGSVPLAASSVSGYPSPSSSVSVTSGVPSPSVSLCTVISTIFVTLEPSGFVTTTGISNLRVSSVVPQSVTVGVPLIVNAFGSYVTPFGNFVVSTVTVESIFPVPIRIGEIGVLSMTVCV